MQHWNKSLFFRLETSITHKADLDTKKPELAFLLHRFTVLCFCRSCLCCYTSLLSGAVTNYILLNHDKVNIIIGGRLSCVICQWLQVSRHCSVHTDFCRCPEIALCTLTSAVVQTLLGVHRLLQIPRHCYVYTDKCRYPDIAPCTQTSADTQTLLCVHRLLQIPRHCSVHTDFCRYPDIALCAHTSADAQTLLCVHRLLQMPRHCSVYTDFCRCPDIVPCTQTSADVQTLLCAQRLKLYI